MLISLPCIQIFHIFFIHIFVPITPNVGSVTCSLCTTEYHFWSYRFAFVRPTNTCEAINEPCCQIICIVSKFGSFVVPRKYMMIVMPTFAQSTNADGNILNRTNTSEKIKIVKFLQI